jgi:hypothetical protein
MKDSAGSATSYGLQDRVVGVRDSVGLRIFSTSSRTALGLIQAPIQWAPELFPHGKTWKGSKLTTHKLMLSSRKRGLYIHSHHTPP